MSARTSAFCRRAANRSGLHIDDHVVRVRHGFWQVVDVEAPASVELLLPVDLVFDRGLKPFAMEALVVPFSA